MKDNIVASFNSAILGLSVSEGVETVSSLNTVAANYFEGENYSPVALERAMFYAFMCLNEGVINSDGTTNMQRCVELASGGGFTIEPITPNSEPVEPVASNDDTPAATEGMSDEHAL